MTTVLRLKVYNSPGVLDRVAGLFRHNGWSIESISAGASMDNTTYINISFKNRYVDMKMLSKQIAKMDFVIDWEECTSETHIMRELLLLKIHKSDFENLRIQDKRVIFEEKDSLLLECIKTPWEIDELLRTLEVIEFTRSGVTMISRLK